MRRFFPTTKRLALAAASAAAACILAAAPAFATNSPTVTFTSPTGVSAGVAGWYVSPNAQRISNGDRLTGVRSTFYLRKQAEYSPGLVNLGVELCEAQSLGNPTTAAAVLYVKWTGTVFQVWAAHTSSSNCLAALGGTGAQTLIDTIPAGHTVFLSITQSPTTGLITYTDSDQTTLSGGVHVLGGFDAIRFDRSGVGTNADAAHLTTPATQTLANFTQSATRDTQKGWADLFQANLTRFVNNEVVCSTNGALSGAILLPASPKVDGFKLLMGQQSS